MPAEALTAIGQQPGQAAAGLGNYLSAKEAGKREARARQEAMQWEREKEQQRIKEREQDRLDRQASRDRAYASYQERLNDWRRRHGWKDPAPLSGQSSGGGNAVTLGSLAGGQ